ERPGGPRGQLVAQAAGQPLLPPRPGLAGLAGAGQGQGERRQGGGEPQDGGIETLAARQPGLVVAGGGGLPDPQGLVMTALKVEGPGQVVVAGGGAGVVLPHSLERAGQGAAVHRLRLGVLPPVLEGEGQVVVVGGGAGVVLAQRLERDG